MPNGGGAEHLLFLSLFPVPSENRCFLRRGADDVVKMWLVFVLVWAVLNCCCFGFLGFNWKIRKMLNNCVQN